MNAPHPSAETLFAAALERPAGAGRSAFLAEACASDAALRARVEALLRAHDDAAQVMATSAFEPPAQPATVLTEKPGDRIGRYKLLQKIGEGGCGVVYMAEQQEPVVRRVALKVIKLGMDTKEVVARFEAERQALALMDHTNIARVLDGGATETGRPFFVMELVRGVPITKYCDEQNLSTAARLELFTSVCHAVQHAHQKGIIHRDLKPSNILVTLHDGVPVPKVIDFDIAKATQGRLTDATLFTAFEQFIGTPAYMNPEQAELSGLDIDTRSDIYSLGVLLYELLTGRPPFDPKSLLNAGLDEIRRIIREVDPPRPSTRLSTLTDADQSTIAKQRATAPAQLGTILRGDLDWIVMRCLEKDRTRRYDTPSALAADIARHLTNEPVTARPPSAGYRLQKFVRRHRVGVAVSTVITAVLLGAIALSQWSLLQERAALRRAVAAEQARGELHAQILQLPRLFHRATNLLDEGRHQEAETVIGEVIKLERTLLGPEDALLAGTLVELGALQRKLGRAADAEVSLRESLRIFVGQLRRGTDPVSTLDVRRVFQNLLEMTNDDSRRAALNAQCDELIAATERQPEMRLQLLRLRVDLLARQWRWREVMADLQRLVEAAPNDVDSAYWLAPLLVHFGSLDEYRALRSRLLPGFAGSHNAQHLRRVSKAALLIPLHATELSVATRMADRAVEINRTDRWGWFGKALAEYRQGRFPEAIEWARRLLDSNESLNHRHVQTELLLAAALHGVSRAPEAKVVFDRAKERAKATLPKPESGRPPTADWQNHVITEILFREVALLLPEHPVSSP